VDSLVQPYAGDRTAPARLFERARRSAVFWSGREDAPRTISLFGFDISNVAIEAAAHDMIAAALRGSKRRVVFVNAHVINTAAADADYARVVAGADRLYADGIGMALAARLCGRELIDNVNGTDLFPVLCEGAAKAGLRIFLLGSRPGVAAAAAQRVADRGLGRCMAGTHHGFFNGGSDERAAIDAINASGASVVLVGMGVPTQDIWIARHAPAISAPVIAGVGGLLDFFAGGVSRAPVLLREWGMEWCWRLSREPGRMWRRYILGNPAFVARSLRFAIGQRWSAKGGGDKGPTRHKGGRRCASS
jgi:exopolysaccharide biosynthesis WecB/TagA/CpsF family protein